jgi:polysaccharide export outer membrane protein
MKSKIRIYSFLFLLLIVSASCASRKFTYFQTQEKRKGQIFDLPTYLKESVVRFKPDDILGITVNVPGEQTVASDYNLPLVPAATSENSTEESVNTGVGRQAFLIAKDGTIDFPVLGLLKVEGYTQAELEKFMKERLAEKLKVPTVVTVRLLNFTITFGGEVGSPGPKTITKDHINLFEALQLAGDMSVYGKRDDVRVFRQKQDGGYTVMSLDMSNEDIISSPYFFLQQNDMVYVLPSRSKTQSADISPRYSFIIGISSLALTLLLTFKIIK